MAIVTRLVMKIDSRSLKGFLTRKSILLGKVTGRIISDKIIPIFERKSINLIQKNKQNIKSEKIDENKHRMKLANKEKKRKYSINEFLNPEINTSSKYCFHKF